MRITVPVEYALAASGIAASSEPTPVAASPGAPSGRWLYSFATSHPVRYLGVVVSRMIRADVATVALDIVVPPPPPPPRSVTLDSSSAPPKPPPVGGRNTIDLVTMGNRRQENRARDALATTADILRFYASLIGDAPYPAFTWRCWRATCPAATARPTSRCSTIRCRRPRSCGATTRSSFNDFPEFILAHEVAHQWWGQAVGWKNYHEQWISEAFAQDLRRPRRP